MRWQAAGTGQQKSALVWNVSDKGPGVSVLHVHFLYAWDGHSRPFVRSNPHSAALLRRAGKTFYGQRHRMIGKAKNGRFTAYGNDKSVYDCAQ